MPVKRKRPEETSSQPTPDQPPATRRATRHTPVHPPNLPFAQPPPPPPPPPPVVTNTTTSTGTAAPVQTPVPIPTPPEPPKRGRGRPPINRPPQPASDAHLQQPQPQPQPGVPSVPSPRSRPETTTRAQARDMASVATMGDGVRPSNLVAPEITYHVPQPQQPDRLPLSSLVRPHGPSAQPPRLNNKKATQHLVPVVTPVPPPKPPAQAAAERPPLRADRTIDKVVFGNYCFRTWYPSYYGKELLGGEVSSGTGVKGGSKDVSKKDRENPLVLERLHVCPSCFKYSKELVAWWGHVKVCQSKRAVPGRKIYTHPRGARKVLVPQDASKGSGPRKRRGDGGTRYVEQVVQDEGEWSIWEVDGEKDALFCQNLSLFAKLFLDNKSVFFDVASFNYYLLVYTPPMKPADGSGSAAPSPLPQATGPQVTGFFSKEKMSWDNNNLACILVFPPWQRKGLGALLMGASYEMSRREGIMGGPEKPISDLGKKGYKRFWAGEIARWLLGLDTSGSDEVVVDVNDCSQATWISLEDCLYMLREMKITEDAGQGPAKRVKTTATDAARERQEGEEHEEVEGAEEKPEKLVPRVRVDKEVVRRYLARHRISLERSCDPNGFTLERPAADSAADEADANSNGNAEVKE
ncbi:hypothetical protein S40293_04745 [Stachybotrys chartarum IBT 40293]|nr:hypothetical protein S40293_04745 [Stachybotrys chartarum IBT 40293]